MNNTVKLHFSILFAIVGLIATRVAADATLSGQTMEVIFYTMIGVGSIGYAAFIFFGAREK